MNINPISANPIATNFGCNDSNCKNCCCEQTLPQQPQQDTVEISKFQKVKNACKNGVSFVKNNHSAIGASARAVGVGLLTACTILGANQLMSKVSKKDTASLAAKLAAFGGIAAGATDLIKHKDVFTKNKQAESKK